MSYTRRAVGGGPSGEDARESMREFSSGGAQCQFRFGLPWDFHVYGVDDSASEDEEMEEGTNEEEGMKEEGTKEPLPALTGEETHGMQRSLEGTNGGVMHLGMSRMP